MLETFTAGSTFTLDALKPLGFVFNLKTITTTKSPRFSRPSLTAPSNSSAVLTQICDYLQQTQTYKF